MRRWNGWGLENIEYPLPESALTCLERVHGKSVSITGDTLNQVLEQIPPARTPLNPLIISGSIETLSGPLDLPPPHADSKFLLM